MIMPDYLLSYAISKGVFYIYDADGNGSINTNDIDKIAQGQHVVGIERFKLDTMKRSHGPDIK
jgi:hypothetical protein